MRRKKLQGGDETARDKTDWNNKKRRRIQDMKVIDFGKGFSGKIGGVVYYEMNGKLYARSAPRQRTREELENVSETVKGINRRFKVIQQLYSLYRKHVSPDIWRLAAKEQGKMAHNLFHSVNCGCLDGAGKMVSPELFRFSEGVLLLPRGLAVEALGGERYRVTWEEEREMTTAAGTDRLQAGVLYDSNLLALHTAVETSGRRRDGQGEFRLDAERGPKAHVYLYFAREDGTAYSPSQHFHVPEV